MSDFMSVTSGPEEDFNIRGKRHNGRKAHDSSNGRHHRGGGSGKKSVDDSSDFGALAVDLGSVGQRELDTDENKQAKTTEIEPTSETETNFNYIYSKLKELGTEETEEVEALLDLAVKFGFLKKGTDRIDESLSTWTSKGKKGEDLLEEYKRIVTGGKNTSPDVSRDATETTKDETQKEEEISENPGYYTLPELTEQLDPQMDQLKAEAEKIEKQLESLRESLGALSPEMIQFWRELRKLQKEHNGDSENNEHDFVLLIQQEENLINQLQKAQADIEDLEVERALERLGTLKVKKEYTQNEVLAICNNPNIKLPVLLSYAEGLSKETIEEITQIYGEGRTEDAIRFIQREINDRYFLGHEGLDPEENYQKALKKDTEVLELVRLLGDKGLVRELEIAIQNGVIEITSDGKLVNKSEVDDESVDYINDLRERIVNTFRDEYLGQLYNEASKEFSENSPFVKLIKSRITELDKILREEWKKGNYGFESKSQKALMFFIKRGEYQELQNVEDIKDEISRLETLRSDYLLAQEGVLKRTTEFRLDIFEALQTGQMDMQESFEIRAYAKELIKEETKVEDSKLFRNWKEKLGLVDEEKDQNVPYLTTELMERHFTKKDQEEIALKHASNIKAFIETNTDLQLSDNEFQNFLVRSSVFKDIRDTAILLESIPKYLGEHTQNSNFSNESVRFAMTEMIETQATLDRLQIILLKEFAKEFTSRRFNNGVEGNFVTEFVAGFRFDDQDSEELTGEAENLVNRELHDVQSELDNNLEGIQVGENYTTSDTDYGNYSEPVLSRRSSYVASHAINSERLNNVRSGKKKVGFWRSIFATLLGGNQ